MMPKFSIFIPHLDMTAEGLKEWRTAAQLSQGDLATLLDVNSNTLARWERGDIPIGQPRMLSLSLQAISFSLSVASTIHRD